MKRLLIVLCILIFWANPSFAQQTDNDLLELSLEDLMNIEIVTASKKVEMLFNSPLSASVITANQIKNSGATTIPEVLRLAPGLIVREQSSGNFDVHIRGFDNVPPQSEFNESTNSTTLVMINNRVVYNYFAGGTFWESLPIDINSIEKIEIVRGPSSALYGPNAVNGVINIITKKPKKEGATITGSYESGNYNSIKGFQSYAYKQDNFDISVSGNFQLKDRQSTKYYEHLRSIYLNNPDDLRGFFTGRPTQNISTRYPDPELGMQKMGFNSFMHYTFSDHSSLGLSTGYQNSIVQKVFVETRRTPLTTNKSETYYIDAIAKHRDISTQISYLAGEQDTPGSEGWRYKLHTLDVNSEYNYENGNLNIKPGISYRLAHYDGQFIDGTQHIYSTALFVRSEYTVNDLRLILALRGDKYNHPDNPYYSYQSSASYTIDPNNLVRIVVSRSHRAPFILRNYLDKSITSPISVIINQGNKDLDLLQMDMYEAGYRYNISPEIKIDMELFYVKSKNFSTTADSTIPSITALDTIYNQYINTKLKAEQYGFSTNIEFPVSKNLNLKLFGSVQQTQLSNFQPLPWANPDSTLNFENKSTPTFYGGFSLNYQPYDKWHLNLNGYFYSRQTFKHLTKDTAIPSKFILNSKISYKVDENAKIYFNMRNLLNDNEVEYAFSDKIGRTILAGVDFSF